MAVLLETSIGDMVVDLFYEKCPKASINFIKLCKNKHFNDSLFNKVEKDYLAAIRTIEPPKTIFTSEYFPDEIHPEFKHNKIGLLSTANEGPNLNNSNIFFTLANFHLTSLDGKHSIFG